EYFCWLYYNGAGFF
nr:immunoglobulin light chain junction region [Macaca mulatta]